MNARSNLPFQFQLRAVDANLQRHSVRRGILVNADCLETLYLCLFPSRNPFLELEEKERGRESREQPKGSTLAKVEGLKSIHRGALTNRAKSVFRNVQVVTFGKYKSNQNPPLEKNRSPLQTWDAHKSNLKMQEVGLARVALDITIRCRNEL